MKLAVEEEDDDGEGGAEADDSLDAEAYAERQENEALFERMHHWDEVYHGQAYPYTVFWPFRLDVRPSSMYTWTCAHPLPPFPSFLFPDRLSVHTTHLRLTSCHACSTVLLHKDLLGQEDPVAVECAEACRAILYDCMLERRLLLIDTITDELVCSGLLPKDYKVRDEEETRRCRHTSTLAPLQRCSNC